jgi:thiamine-phosphate pyrophosphorylase
VRRARALLGPDAILGAHGGATRHRAMGAAEAGADYVSLGPVDAGGLGDGAEAGPELFAWWAEMIETPSVAEGGMTPARARALSDAADHVAARFSVWNAPEGHAAAAAAYAAALHG